MNIWNLIAYDYTGSWSNATTDQANLFRSSEHPESTPFDTESVINYYTSQGISPTKIILGMPLYGRYFNSTSGLGETFSGARTYSVKDLLLEGATVVVYDYNTRSSYSYNVIQRQLVSYNNIDMAKQKVAFI
jgi:chitinase